MATKKTQSRLADLVLKRTQSDPAAPLPTEKVELLIDSEGHASLRPQWEAAQQAAKKADLRLQAIEANPEIVKGRAKMNDEPPIEAARREASEAHAAADKLRDELRECFVVITLRGLTTAEVNEAGKLDDLVERKRWQLERAIVSVTDANGANLPELTAAVMSTYLEGAPAGEEARVWTAINKAAQGVDFPT